MAKKKILVVEDERLIAEDIRRTLIYLGYDVVATVSTGEDAIAIAKKIRPDLTLMDVMLEGELNGIEAAKIIHRDLRIPIIFLTAYSNDKTLEAATAAEPFGYILKPFEERELRATVEMALYKFNMQQKLKNNEKKYRDIFENAIESICIIKNGIINFSNSKTLDLLKYTKDYIATKPFLDFVHPDDKKKVKEIYESILNNRGKSGTFNFRIIDNNNQTLWLKSNVVNIDWEDEPALLNFLSNITDQVLAKEEIQKFKMISDNANYGITITGIDNKIQYINKYFAGVHGYKPEDLIDKNLSLFHNQKQIKTLNEMNEQLKKNGSINAVELWHTHRDGHTFPMLMNGILISAQNETRQFIAASAIDITDRKKSEKIQNDLFKELEHVNNELQNFAYVVSHDLKAPLRAISTLTNWISSDYADKFDEEGKEQLRLLITRVKRMHDLIDGVLEYSRVGRIKEEKIEVDLNELLPEIIETLAPPKHIDIKIKNDLPSIFFERTRITQVFQNLISNAIKFMDKKKGKIFISGQENSNEWRFEVSDNGPGIDTKHFDKIFKIFQTLQPRDEFESTGIGLTLIKKIIDMYGGKIWLESELGKGVTFIFTIPRIYSTETDEKESLDAENSVPDEE